MLQSIIQILYILWSWIIRPIISCARFFSAKPKSDFQLPTVTPVIKKSRLPPAPARGSSLPRHSLAKNQNTKVREAANKRGVFSSRTHLCSTSPVTAVRSPPTIRDDHFVTSLPDKMSSEIADILAVQSTPSLPGSYPEPLPVNEFSALAYPGSPTYSSASSSASTSPPTTPEISFAALQVPRIITSSPSNCILDISDHRLEDLESGLAASAFAKRRGFKGAPLVTAAISKKPSFTSLSGKLSPRSPFTPDTPSFVSAVSGLMRSPSPRSSKFNWEPVPQYIQDDYNEADPFGTSADSYCSRDDTPFVTTLSENLYDISFYTQLSDDNDTTPTNYTTTKNLKQSSTNVYDMSIYDIYSEGYPKSNRKKRTRKCTESKQLPCSTPTNDILPASDSIPLVNAPIPVSSGKFPPAATLLAQNIIPVDLNVEGELGGPNDIYIPPPVDHAVCEPPVLPVVEPIVKTKRHSGLKPLILPQRVAQRNSCLEPLPESDPATSPITPDLSSAKAEGPPMFHSALEARRSKSIGEIIALLDVHRVETEEMPSCGAEIETVEGIWNEESFIGMYAV